MPQSSRHRLYEWRYRRALTMSACAMLALWSFGLCDAAELHRVTFLDANGVHHVIEARLLVKAVDGGLLLLGRDGRLWNVTPDQLQKHDVTEQQFEPFDAERLGDQLQEELGDEFRVVTTRHYVICSNAGPKYVQWCGALFERLMGAFQTHWKSRTLKLYTPECPLVAIVFANQSLFAEFATQDAGPDAATAPGYYSIPTNRMVLYDLTAGSSGGPAGTTVEINRRMATSLFNVATIVHEATHQIAFNSGMLTRYADNPLWLSEGMAMYFETPDLKSRSGWRTVGQPNRGRLRWFADFLAKRRPPDSLTTLVSSDDRFRDPELAGDAYAESWALTYFLIKTKRSVYLEYLHRIAAKPRLIVDRPDDRLREFQAAFGQDLDRLDREFLQYLRRVARSL